MRFLVLLLLLAGCARDAYYPTDSEDEAMGAAMRAHALKRGASI